jgi:hypothetical protein
MPQNIAIAAFVLGAVLLLASLLTGGFKIFGAEVTGTVGKTGRVLAFVLGLVFVMVGIGYHDPQEPKPAERPAATAPTVTTNAPPVDNTPAMSDRTTTRATTYDRTQTSRPGSVTPLDERLPSGYGMQVCGCWGFNPRPVAPEPRCQSGYVRLNWCPAYCPAGGTQYAYVCQ